MSEPALPKSVTSEFRWMHLSDLHVGMMEQDWLWPTLKHSLYADMEMMLASAGPLDAMIFSGDLTQRGIPDEFDKLDSILGELWDKFRSWGFSPKLLVLPGNHDICRAPSLSPELRLLRKWWEEPEIHGDFFGSDSCIYRDAASALLAPYRAWATRNSTRFELLRGTNGLLPGDQSHVVRVGDFDIGIVNLNSTWLQIDGADYKGKLHVDAKQLLAVTKNDPHAWCSAHAFNIVVTHHPLDWLHHNSQAYWHSDINPAGRFDLHLFGHMHEPAVQSLSSGGSRLKNSIQAASAFGLSYTNASIERIHGYPTRQ